MSTHHGRIVEHPILPVRLAEEVPFTWRGQPLVALEGETLAAALLANGVQVFGHHLKDGAPQGIYCANGQCAQCMVLVDGRPVKSCMTLVQADMHVEPLDALPALPASPGAYQPAIEMDVPVLILGGGPAGLSAAIELGRRGIQTLLIDDRHRLGAEFHFCETVTGIVVRGGCVRGVRTDRGDYGAEVVIDAAGAQARAVAGMAGEDVPVFPDAHEAGVTEPVARFLQPLVVDLRPFPGSSSCYFSQIERGQVLFCLTPSPSIWGEDTRETSQFLPTVADRLIRLVPRLQHIRVRRTWRGLYPMTPDGLPIVGWSRAAEGLLLAAGMCGQGFMLGPGVGELLARVMQGALSAEDEKTLADLSPYRAFAGQEKLK